MFSSCSGSCDVNSKNINAGLLQETAGNLINIDRTAAANDPLRIKAIEIASAMNDRHLAAQLLITGIDGRRNLPLYMVNMLSEIPTGGVMLFRYNLDTDNESIKSLLSQTSMVINESSGIPPFVAVDHEGGTVNRFLSGVATLPDASLYWNIYLEEGFYPAIDKIKSDSFKAGSVIKDLGINMNFAPIAEHLTDDNRIFLSRRSYGPDIYFTSQAADAFMQGMHEAGVFCVIKHFPGSAGPDPHYSASVIYRDRQQLDILVSPFASLINNGARAVMAAHTLIPAIDNNNIASLSPYVMQNWLRGDLGFDGIIISDDFIMEAAGGLSSYQATVQSIIAGADMILVWPGYLRDTHNAILSALEDGTLSRQRLLDAAQNVIYEKLRFGLMK